MYKVAFKLVSVALTACVVFSSVAAETAKVDEDSLRTEIGQIIELKAKNDFYGAVYAPNASISIKAKGDIYGSFVGNDFELKSYGKVHYDKALAEANIDDTSVYFAVNSWREE